MRDLPDDFLDFFSYTLVVRDYGLVRRNSFALLLSIGDIRACRVLFAKLALLFRLHPLQLWRKRRIACNVSTLIPRLEVESFTCCYTTDYGKSSSCITCVHVD